ncbi:hypothetical protein [Leuconostoc mesenteroides]|uniref:hypothetical protein n=1 Tax=Leuconostoc mesenteroides TaxID=1245 RepID=UPI001E5FDF23|nr:hypothetical protein [Leuconostoc mesenteroides]
MSTPYIISYDLHAPGQKYEELKKAIIGFNGAYIKILESTWLVKNNLTPDEMSDKIRSIIDSNDRLFITEVTSPYQGQLTQDDWKFIRENIYN